MLLNESVFLDLINDEYDYLNLKDKFEFVVEVSKKSIEIKDLVKT